MEDKKEKGPFVLSTNSMVCCLAFACANNIQSACNLKGVTVDDSGRCTGLTKVSKKKAKK